MYSVIDIALINTLQCTGIYIKRHLRYFLIFKLYTFDIQIKYLFLIRMCIVQYCFLSNLRFP